MGENTEITTCQVTDKSEASARQAADRALQEVNDWRQKLVGDQKQTCQGLKDGKRKSGVTGPLGKLEIVDAKKADARSAISDDKPGGPNGAGQQIEYSNGVRTSRSEGRTTTSAGDEGTQVQPEAKPPITIDLSNVKHQPTRQERDRDGKPTGTILDGQNRPVCKSNDDGSVSIYERDSKGTTVMTTEYPNGVRIRTGEPRMETRDGITLVVESSRIDVPQDGGWRQKDDGSFVHGTGDTTIVKNDDRSITLTTKDGMYTQQANGASVVMVAGRVTEATDADGHTRKFHYDKKGNLDKIDGHLGHWERQKNGVWKNTSTAAEWKGEFLVGSDGNLEFRRGNSVLVFGRNGEATRLPAEASNTLTDDKKSQPDDATAAAKTFYSKVEYGKPTLSDKRQWKSSVDSDGTVRYWYEDFTMEVQRKDGGFQFQYPDGSWFTQTAKGEQDFWHANGDSELYDYEKLISRRRTQPDESSICRNGIDQITSVISPEGDLRRNFRYDSRGVLTEFESRLEGKWAVWKRQVDVTGRVYWQNQEDLNRRLPGTMRVEADGGLLYTPNDKNAQAWVLTRDGRSVPAARLK